MDPKSAPRTRVKCGRIAGQVVRWQGEEGWIRPDKPIEHPFRQSQGLVVKQKDVAAGQSLKPGNFVDFLVYSETVSGGRLGAEYCRLLPQKPLAKPINVLCAAPSQPKGVVKPGLKARPPKHLPKPAAKPAAKPAVAPAKQLPMPKLAAKLLAKPAAKPVQIGRKIGSLLIAKQPAQPKHAPPMPLARKFNVLKLGLKTKPVKAATPAKPGTWVIVKPVTAAAKPMAGPAVHGQVTKIPAKTSAQPQLVKPALGLLKTQGATAAPGQKVRTQITFVPQGGRISKWLGNFGWITPDKPVPRPEAAKHNGQVFLHKDDLQVEQQPHAGSRVNFCLYVDHSGLGAMNCALAAGAIVAQGKAGNNIGKAGVGKAGAAQSSKAGAAQGKAGAGKAGAAQGKAGAGKAGAAQGKAAQGKAGAAQGKAAQGKAAQGKGTSKKATSPLSTQEKPLPPFWEEHWSEEYNMPYFWHSKKQEPSWIRPT